MATPNPFDQFDAMPVAREEPPAPRTANPFDQFDTPSSAPVTGANPFDQFDAQPVANANSITPDIAEQTAQALIGPALSRAFAPTGDAGPSMRDVISNPELADVTLTTPEGPSASWADTLTGIPPQIGGYWRQTLAGMHASEAAELAQVTDEPGWKKANRDFRNRFMGGNEPDPIPDPNSGAGKMRAAGLRMLAEDEAKARQAQADIEAATPANQTLGQKAVSGGATSLSVMFPSLFVGAATRNPTIALAPMYATTYGNSFSEGLIRASDNAAKEFERTGDKAKADVVFQKGLAAADKHAAIQGLIEVGTEMLPAATVLKQGSPLKKRIVNYLIEEVPGESAATMGQALDSYIAQLPGDATVQDVIDGLEKGIEQLPETLATVAVTGGPIVGAGHLMSGKTKQEDTGPTPAQIAERARIDAALGRTQYQHGARLEPEPSEKSQTAATPAPQSDTMPPPASTGSPPPASASKLGSAPLDVAQESATPPTPPPAPAPVAQAAAETPPAQPAQPAPTQAAQTAAPAPEVAPQKTEVPPAAPAPPVSTPAPAPHAETVTQPGAAQAGGTTAPASKNDVDVDFLEGVARDYEAEGNTQAAAQIRAEAAKASAQNQVGQSAPKTKEPPAAFREDDDEVEQVREMFGLPPPPPEAKTQYEGEDRPKKPPDEAKQVFNQIAGNNPNAKKMLEKRIAKLPAEARQKVTDWIAERTKHLKNVATRIEENREGLNRFAESAGWAQKGGGITRKPTDVDQFGNPEPQSGPVTGRLSWLPHAPWFDKVQGDVMDASGRKKRAQNTRSDLPGNMKGEATKEAVRKALAGEPMSISERRHINGMLDELDNERGEAEKEGLDNFDPFAAAQAIGETHRPADEPAASSVDVALVHRASQLDEAAVERAAVTHEQDDAAFMQAIRDIIATHEQGKTSNAGGEAVRGTPGREEAAPDFQLESPAAPAAKPAAQKVAPPQGELLPKDQTKQDLADHERAKDQKRSPGTNVPADEGGGLFSKENKQTDVTDVTELDDDIGTTAAMGPEASLSESEANSRNNKRDEKFTEPSTARENLMEAIGIDPTELRLQGGQEQFNTIRKAIMDRYGYKYIHKHASQVWRNASDHLLDAFESLQNMAAVMGVSPQVMSLNGKLGLNLQRNTKARGLFYPDLNLISIFDQQDVFAHEFGHAIDYNLMEERGGTMTPGGLSAAIRKREGTAMLPETVGQAYADLMTALYYDGAHIAQLIKTAEHQLEKAKTDKRRAQLTKRLENIRSGAWRGHEGKTNFYQRAKNGPMKAYLTKPTELIARSFEAYISAKIQMQKELGLVKFLGASNAIYSNEADAWIKRVYPQDSERAQIFAAWDNLMGQLTREGIYDTSVPVGIADSKVNLGLMDPVAQAKMAGLPLTPDIVAAKNLTDKAAQTWHKDEVRNRDTIRNNTRALLKGLKEGTPDTLQHLNALMRSFGSTPDGVFSYLEGRFPKNAALRKIRDLFSDAQIHGRNKSLGIYRETQRQERQLVTEVEQRLAAVGIVPNMSEEWQSRMWDIMHGYDKPANAVEKRQADQLRFEYDRLFKLRDQHGVGLGYTAERYMNRITHRAVADSIGYQQDVIKLRKAEKQALLEKLKAKLEAAKTEEEQKDIRAAIKRTLQIDPVAATQAQIAKMKGADWTSAVTLGALSEDSAKERVFGPLADKMLKKYYVKDPIDLLSTYAGSAAREMVQKRRLGDKPNAAIQALLTEASQDLPSAYVDLLKFSMQTSLGMQTIGTSMPGSKILSAYSTISNAQMLGRASIPNLSEPFGVLSKSLTPLKTLGDLMKASVPLMRSQSKKARYAAADRLGRLSGILVDSAHSMTAQAQTTGDDTQGKGLVSRVSQKTYRFNLLTPITAAHEKIINRMGLEAFYDAAESIRANDNNAAMYGQWLREHGIKNTASFAEFLKGPESIENLTVVDTLSGDGLALANALHHYVTTTIQNPTPTTKMLMANRGNFGLIYRLTSWMSTNFVNWAKQNAKKLESARTGKYGDVQLTAKQRLNAMALPVLSTMGTMYVAQAFFVVARMLLTRADDWDDRGEDFWDRFTSKETQMQILQYWGLLGWLSNVVIDTTVGARSNRGLFATLAGPVYGPIVQDVERWIAYFRRNSEDTNQGERNAVEASYHLLSMMITFGLGAVLPQSKAYGQIIGFLWSFFGTSPQMSKEVATLVAGPKKGEIDTSTAAGREQLREKKEDEAAAAEKKTESSADKKLDRTFEEN
jgi:hypothetical protein